ncbi:MAG TPA: hypothetical protein VK502_02605, partial [Candidatus Saccharimonadales bacterium]|nr:hypothetical protein [Candidatus Saccharimonadales bacterium]
QLQEMLNDLAASYRLGSDIDCSDTNSWNSGVGFVPVGGLSTPFQGTLDGAGYAISGLTINRPSTDYVGLFGYISGGGLARNIRFDDVSIIGQHYVGGVAGRISGGDGIYEVGITGEVSGVTAVGGVVGRNDYLVMNSYSHATISGVSGSGTGGGLAGENGGFILRSYSTGIVPNGPGKGGIIGYDADSGGSPGTFWDKQASGITVSAGDGVSKTTDELKNIATFTDTATFGLGAAWDFVGNPNNDTANDDIWSIDPLINQGYPYLADQYPAAPTTTITTTNSPASLTTNAGTDGTTKTSLHRGVAQASTTSQENVTTGGSTPELNNPNSVVQIDTSNDDIKKSDTTSTNFVPWVIGGFSLLILVLIGYIVYRWLQAAA